MDNNVSLIIKALGFSPELLQNKIPVIESLLNDLNENIITSDDVSEQLEHMTRREIILNRQKNSVEYGLHPMVDIRPRFPPQMVAEN